MPLILPAAVYERWLSEEPDPRDLMRPFTAGLMRMWPISTRVNKPENDGPSIIEPIELASNAAQLLTPVGEALRACMLEKPHPGMPLLSL
jgi:hypothetical protein